MIDWKLSANDISVHYKGQASSALRSCTVTIQPGELIAVVGHNGAGKSTLFDVLGGLLTPSEGRVHSTLHSSDIGWCPQREVIDWSLTVQQNISLGLDIRKRLGKSARQATISMVAQKLGLTQYLDRTAETLSGGELRRTQIARAMAGDPRLLILDEPTAGLDPAGTHLLFTYLHEKREQGASALVSTHETSRFAEYCTRVISLQAGRILADEPVDVFMSRAPRSNDLWDAYEEIIEKESPQ